MSSLSKDAGNSDGFAGALTTKGRRRLQGGRMLLRMEAAMTADPAYRAVANQVDEARRTLIELARTEPRWWEPYELKTRAQNGTVAGAVALALNALIDEGTFEVGPRGVRLRTA